MRPTTATTSPLASPAAWLREQAAGAAPAHFGFRVWSAAPGDSDEEWDTGTVVEEQPAKPKLEHPPMYKVIMLNDDYTPMEFVVGVLMHFFHMEQDKAWQIMYAVHTTGSAVVGIYPRDIAETKSEQVNAYAQENQYPLRSTVEMTD